MLSGAVTVKPAALSQLYGGANSDSGARGVPASFDGIDKYRTDNSLLHDALYEARVIKSPREIDIIRYANEARPRRPLGERSAKKRRQRSWRGSAGERP